MKTKKYSIIGLLCLIMMVSFVFGVACNKYVDNGENGKFCTVYDGKEYSVTLNEGEIVLDLAGTKVTGTYTYDGVNISVEFDDETVNSSASIDGDAITVTYEGNSYTFLKCVDYIVTFYDGESVITTQTVDNGRNATKPTAPQKAGYRFIEWYADAAFTTYFDFSSSIRQDVAVYARYVQVAEGTEEYVVNFSCDTAQYDEVETIGGVVYNLPTPVKAGVTFAGWFVSQYGTADKISYKYDGQVIKEDTTLYAVWATAKVPVIEGVTANAITWRTYGVSATGNNYTVKVIKNGEPLAEQIVNGTSYEFDFANAEEGDYVITVTLNDKTATSYYKNKALAKISHFEVVTDEAGNDALSWNVIENAENYLVSLTCGDENHSHIDEAVNGNQYVFANCAMQEGGIVFTVKAVAEGYAPSSATYRLNRTLGQVTGVAYANDYVTWDKVENATHYEVTVTAGTDENTYTVTNESYYVGNYTGNVKVSVKAISKKYNSVDATDYDFVKTTIAAPSTVTVAGNVITWTAVDGAVSYNVKIGDKVKMVTTNSYTVVQEDIVDGVVEYDISVQAIAADVAKSSGYTQTVKAVYGKFYADPVYNNHVVTWDVVLGSAYYGVTVNTATEVKVTDGAVSYNVGNVAEGDNTVKVVAYDSDDQVLDEKTINVAGYKVTLDVCGGKSITNNVYVYAKTDVLVLDFNMQKFGYDFTGWYNVKQGAANGKNYKTGDQFEEEAKTTLYAYWTPKTYNITLDLGSQKNIAVLEQYEYQIKYGEKQIISTDGSKNLPVPDTSKVTETTQFSGWYTEANMGGSQFTNEKGVIKYAWEDVKDITLYAGWAESLSFKAIYNPVTGQQNGAYSVSQGAEIGTRTSIKIPETYKGLPVTTIEANAFFNNKYLIEIQVPKSIINIEFGYTNDNNEEIGSAFSGCTKIKTITAYDITDKTLQTYVDESEYSYVEGSILRTTAANELELKYVPYAYAGEYNIPEGVKRIADRAFACRNAITKITIPYTVTYIGAYAFYCSTSTYSNNSKLVTIECLEAPEGEVAEELTINVDAFNVKNPTPTTIVLRANMSDQTDVATMLSTQTSLVNVSLVGEGKYSIIELKDGEKTTPVIVKDNEPAVGGKVLVYAPTKMAIANVVIPSGITAIGEMAFYGNKELKTLVIDEGVVEIGASAFEKCTALTTLTIDSYPVAEAGSDPNKSLVIQESAFSGCNSTSQKALVIPARVSYIGTEAFYNTRFTSVEFDNTVASEGRSLEIADEAFRNNSKISSITITPVVKKIGYYAFFCSALKTVNLECDSDDIVFDVDAFGTSYVTKVVIGEKVPILDLNGIFGNKVATVEINENNTAYAKTADNIVFSSDYTRLVLFPAGYATEYAIPETVEHIGNRVFYNRTDIKKITIGKNVSYIGDYTFSNCSNLNSLIFEEGGSAPLTIGNNAFERCSSLTEVKLATRTVSIGDMAFSFCQGLSEIVIPEGVKTMGDRVFNYCSTKLKSVSLPSTLEKIGNPTIDEDGNMGYDSFDVFYYCNALQSLTVAEGNTHLMAKNNVLYTLKDGAADVLVYAVVGVEGDVVIPNTISKITKGSFNGRKYVKNISFDGDLVNNIKLGDQSFYGCTGLESVVLTSGITEVSRGVFGGCTSLTSIVIPDTVTKIGGGAFTGCSKLQTVTFEESTDAERTLEIEDSYSAITNTYDTGNGVFAKCIALKKVVFPQVKMLTIGTYAFNGCSVLTSIEINSDIDKIGVSAFSGCRNLEEVKGIENATSLTEIGDSMFYNTSIREMKLPEGIVTIGQSAFRGCKKLTYVEIPSTVTLIGSVTGWSSSSGDTYSSNVFQNCTNLTNVVFREGCSIEAIYNYSFSGCTSLKNIEIPATVKSIEYNAFANCAMENFTVPATVEVIDFFAFANTGKLKTITFEKGSNLYKVGNSAFAYSGLQYFAFPESNYTISVGEKLFMGCTNLTTVSLSSKVVNIGAMFMNNSSIESVVIPAANKNLANVSENGCSIIYNVNKTVLKTLVGDYQDEVFEIAENEGITEIGDYAFSGQSKIKKIIIPSTVKYISVGAFSNMPNLEEIVFPDYSQLASLGEGLVEHSGKLQHIQLPETCNLTEIERYTFRRSEITSIYIPASVTTIGIQAFQYSGKLSKITGMEGVTSIGNSAFIDCDSLTEITIPDTVTKIGSSTFSGCANLAKVNGMESVTSIGSSAFNGCTALTEITIPAGVTKIDSSTFTGCTNLTTVNGMAKVTEIAGNAFKNCTSLKTINLEKIKKISSTYAFQNCTSLEEVNLAAVTTLSNYSFNDCTSLKTVILNNALTSLPTYTFSGCINLTTVNIPTSCTKIGGYSFNGCESLVTINMPAKTTTVDTYAFKNCVKLEGIDLSHVTTMGNGAFFGCTSIEEIDISALNVTASTSPTSKSEYFENCINLVNVKVSDKCKVFFSKMFKNCTALSSIYTGNAPVAGEVDATNVAKMGVETFAGCSGIKQIKFGKTLNAINTKTFIDCTGIESIDLSATVLTSVTTSAFEGCVKLAEVKFPAGLTTIGNYAFSGCAVLSSVEITDKLISLGTESFINAGITEFKYTDKGDASEYMVVDGAIYTKSGTLVAYPANKVPGVGTDNEGVVTINGAVGAYAFSGNKGVTKIVIAEGVTEIEANSFRDMTTLKEVVIPSTVTKIDNNAFYNCYNLTTVTFAAGSELKTIMASAFANCSALQTITLPETVTSLGNNAFAYSGLTEIELPEACETFGTGVFSFCADLASVVIPDTITEFGDSMFKGTTSLETINLPDTFVNIGDYTFQESGLVSITIPAKVTVLGKSTSSYPSGYLFENSKKLTSVTILGEVNNIYIGTFNGCEALETVTFKGQTAVSGMLNIPDSVNVIGDKAFAKTAIREVVIGENVTEIGSLNTTSNASYYLNNGSPAFYAMNSLKKVTINSNILAKNVYSFANSESLEEVVIGEGVNNLGYNGGNILGYGMFANCTNLSKVDLGKLELLPDYVFSGCEALETVVIPATVESIQSSAFANSGVKDVTISEGVSYIYSTAFINCTSLESIVIPASAQLTASFGSAVTITSSSINTFAGCTSLRSVEFKGEVSILPGGVFSGCVNLETLKFVDTPAGKTGLYIPETVFVGPAAFNGLPATKTLEIATDLHAVLNGYCYNATNSWLTGIDAKIIIGGEVFKQATIAE